MKATASATPSPSEKFTFLDFIFMLTRHKVFITVITLLTALFTLFYSLLSLLLPPEKSPLPNRYTAKAVILFSNPDKSSPLGDSKIPFLFGAAGNPSQEKAAMIGTLLKKDSTLEALVSQLNLIETFHLTDAKKPYWEACKTLRDHIVIETDDESNDKTITIGYTDINPEFAEKMTLALLPVLQQQYKAMQDSANQEALRILDENILLTADEIDTKLQEFSDFQKQTGLINPTAQISNKTAITTQLQNKIVQTKLSMDKIAAYQGYSNPQVQQLQKEIDELEKAIAMQMEGKGFSSKYNLPLSRLFDLAPEFNKRQKEIEGLQQLYISQRLQRQNKALEIANSIPSFQVIEQPHRFTELNGFKVDELPEKSGPSRAKLCIVSTLLAFFLSSLAACVFEFAKQTAADETEAEKLQLIKATLRLRRPRRLPFARKSRRSLQE